MPASTSTASLSSALNVLEQQRQALLDEYIRRSWKMWQSLSPSDWWNDAIVQGVGASLAQQEMAFISQMRRLGVSYANVLLHMIGSTSASGQVPEYVAVRDNTDPWKVAVKPAKSYRDASIQNPSVRPDSWDGLDDETQELVDQWLQEAYDRLTTVSDTDGEAAMNRAALEQFEASGVRQYRRVVHPELSRSGTCGLCIVAADRVYSAANLMPLHNRCHCTVAPVTGDSDLGLDLNQDDLQRLYEQAYENASEARQRELDSQGFNGYSTNRQDLSKLRVTTVTDGELGPILSRADAEEESDADWSLPDRASTRSQLQDMYDRATVFDNAYDQVSSSNRAVTFSQGGSSYTFKPSDHLQQAWGYQRSLMSSLAVSLGYSA